MYTTQLKKVFISFMLGLMVFSSFSFTAPASATSGLTIETGDISSSFNDATNEVTVTLDVYATPVSTLEALKASITLERTGVEGFADLGADDSVTITNPDSDSTSIVVTLSEALTGDDNTFVIAAEALMNSDDDTYTNSLFIDVDVKKPSYTGSRTYYYGAEVELYFHENISIKPCEENSLDFLKRNMSIATDGINFEPFLEESNFFSRENVIYIGSGETREGRKIILGTNTVIKIDSGTIMDVAGNLNDELLLEVTPPVIESVEISEDYHDVTITYNENIFDNGTSLENQIKLMQGQKQYDLEIVENDELSDKVLINGAKLNIHFKEALSGSNNQIYIEKNSIMDSLGNIVGDHRLTNIIKLGDITDTTAPKVIDYYTINDFQDLVLVFDEEVMAYDEDEESFNIEWTANNNTYYVFPADKITFSGHTVTFQLPEDTTRLQLSLYENVFKDASGNVITESFYSEWMYKDSIPTVSSYNVYFSHNGRLLTVDFNNRLRNQSIGEDRVLQLKNAVTISVGGGEFLPLNPLDIVTIQEYRLVVLFHDAITVGSVQVKIAAGILGVMGYENIMNSEIVLRAAYTSPDITGYFLSNAASEFVFIDNEAWRNNVRDIYIYDSYYGNNRGATRLSSSDYTITAGKLTVNSGVFLAGHAYNVIVDANGYSSKNFEGRAHKSSEIFYITAPTVTPVNGITASINLFNNTDQYYDYNSTGTQTVIFQLMNGTTPVSIVASTLRVGTGTYTANFNVKDAATNSNYKVKAYVVSSYNNDPAGVGLNLATEKTQSEIDELILLSNNNVE